MLYKTVNPDEPCQIVGVHPLAWVRRTEPTAFLIEATVDDVKSWIDSLSRETRQDLAFRFMMEVLLESLKREA